MDKFIKRLQTRASRKGISVSKSQVREVYQSVVTTPEHPSEEEMSAVIQKLEAQYQAPSYEVTNSQLTVTEQPELTQAEEPKEMIQSTPAQPAQQPSSSTLATSNRSSLSHPSDTSTAPTQTQIIEAVEKEFGKENFETKTAILNYVLNDTYQTATELQGALAKLRQMRLDILMKLIADHNQASGEDEKLFKSALSQAAANRQQETEDFFDSFENQLTSVRASFGI
jgi:predicted transcriptional regulator/plasmid stability protein